MVIHETFHFRLTTNGQYGQDSWLGHLWMLGKYFRPQREKTAGHQGKGASISGDDHKILYHPLTLS